MSNYEPPAPPPPPPGGGGYGAPPPAGPPGGYGAPPPAGPPGGYGAPPSGQPWDVGSAVSYGWSKFQANTGQMIIASLAIFAGAVVIYGIAFLAIIIPANSSDYECRFNDAGEYTCSGDAGGLGILG